MNKNHVLIALAILTIGLLLVVMVLIPLQKAEKSEPAPTATGQEKADTGNRPVVEPDRGETEQQQRRQKMEQAFARLEHDRRGLRSATNLLKSLSWGIELPIERARQVNNAMRQAYAYLKNPAMLGAYHEVADIERESRKIAAMLEELEAAKTTLNEAREAR